MWVLLVACHGSSRPTLDVEGGFGGGEYGAGDALRVWADVNPQTELAVWSGDVDLLDTPDEWNAALTMPDHSVSLQATGTNVDAPLESRDYALAAGTRTVLATFPVSPVGIVLFFHGAAYSTSELESNAARTITLQLVRAGFAVVAAPSEAEVSAGTGGWDSTLGASNADLQNVDALAAALRKELGEIPIVAWGMSSGGIFAHTVGASLPADAVVAYCAPGNADALDATSAATAWYLAGNDQTFPDSATDAGAFRTALEGRGIRTDLYVHPPTALYDERFQRIAGIDAERSGILAQAIRDAGAVDEDGSWVVAGSEVTADLTGLEGTDGLEDDALTAVGAEIEIMAADHELYDDAAARMIGFLQAVL